MFIIKKEKLRKKKGSGRYDSLRGSSHQKPEPRLSYDVTSDTEEKDVDKFFDTTLLRSSINSNTSNVSTDESQLFERKIDFVPGNTWPIRDYHHINVDFENISIDEEEKLEDLLTTIRDKEEDLPRKNYYDYYMSLRLEEEKLRREYLEKKFIDKRSKKSRDWEASYNKSDTKKVDLSESFFSQYSPKKTKGKKKRGHWKNTYSKSRFFDGSLYPSHKVY